MTDEEKQAALNPRPGDVWEKGDWHREVTHVNEHRVKCLARDKKQVYCNRAYWVRCCAGARLVKRGKA